MHGGAAVAVITLQYTIVGAESTIPRAGRRMGADETLSVTQSTMAALYSMKSGA